MSSQKFFFCSSLSRKKVWWDCHSHPRQLLRGQNTSVRIGLIELNEPSNALNYKSFLNIEFYKLFYTFLFFIFASKKIFFFKRTELHFIYYFDLVWDGIWCYSIKDSVFLVLFFIRFQGISYSRDNLLEIAIKSVPYETFSNTFSNNM